MLPSAIAFRSSRPKWRDLSSSLQFVHPIAASTILDLNFASYTTHMPYNYPGG